MTLTRGRRVISDRSSDCEERSRNENKIVSYDINKIYDIFVIFFIRIIDNLIAQKYFDFACVDTFKNEQKRQ